MVVMRPASTTLAPSTNTVCTPRPSADHTSWFITLSRGRHSGRSVSCSTTSAFLPGSSEPISSSMSMVRAPPRVAIS